MKNPRGRADLDLDRGGEKTGLTNRRMKDFSRYFPVYFVTDGLGRIGGRYIGRGGCPIRTRTQVRVMKRLGGRLRMLDRTIDSGSGLVFIEPFV